MVIYKIGDVEYRWIGGFGAQISSIETRKYDTRDVVCIAGHLMHPLYVRRYFFSRYEISWSLLGNSINTKQIEQLKKDLEKST